MLNEMRQKVEETMALMQHPAEDNPYAVVEEEIDGVKLRVFQNAPASLREIYVQSVVHERTFLVYEDERYSFQQAHDMAARIANRLVQDYGISKGDRVAIAMRNFPEWCTIFMGSTSSGAITVAVNAWWETEELVYGLEDSGARVLFLDQERLDRLRDHVDWLGIKAIAVRCSGDLPAGVVSFEEFLGEDSPAMRQMPDVVILPDDNATILYTSGSTSRPKGALATHRSIVSALLGWEFGMAAMQQTFPDLFPESEFDPATIQTVPLFHVTGLNVLFLSSFRGGRKVVLMYRWDAEKALDVIEQERITGFNGVPVQSWEIVQSPNFDKKDLKSLQSMGGGGAPMAPEQARQIDHKLVGGSAGTGWGMTETNGHGTSIAGPDLMERPTSCGRPLRPLVEIMIVDEKGYQIPRGETGEIWIKGAMNIRGYWNSPEVTAETITDGWVHTGDIGHMDEEDFVYITDRAKDMVSFHTNAQSTVTAKPASIPAMAPARVVPFQNSEHSTAGPNADPMPDQAKRTNQKTKRTSGSASAKAPTTDNNGRQLAQHRELTLGEIGIEHLSGSRHAPRPTTPGSAASRPST